MHLLSSLLFAASASVDNLTVALAYGVKKVRISPLSNFLIALVSGVGTFVSMALGKVFIRFISAKTANMIGCSILILIGLWCLISPLIKKKHEDALDFMHCDELFNNPEKTDSDKSGTIDVKESFSLAIALMLNNIGFGLAASITNINIYFTSLLTFVLSLVTIFIGSLLGRKYISNALGKYAEYISGMIIILLGVYELLI